MKILFVLFFAIFMSACAQTSIKDEQVNNTNETPNRFLSSHETHYPHTHSHGKNCGHKTETVGFDTVYIHDGHKHKVHAGHVDDIK